MLHEIRCNIYKPDETRSGRLSHEQEVSSAHSFLSRGGDLQEPVLPPAHFSPVISGELKESTAEVLEDLEATLDNFDHVTTGSSSSSEAETVVKPAVYARVIFLPNGTEGWQRQKLRTVHLSFQGYTRALLCGRVIGKFHAKVDAKPFPFDTPTCRQCFHSKLIQGNDA